jgi:hypothetical protein
MSATKPKTEAVLDPKNPDCPYVLKEVCATRTKTARWVISVYFGILGVFLALIVYASGQAAQANTKYGEVVELVGDKTAAVSKEVDAVKSELDTHRAVQLASDKTIVDKLDEVKEQLRAQQVEQKLLLEKILAVQIEVAGKRGE